jgi:IS30 family transposase
MRQLTIEDKQRILTERELGLSYASIASKVGFSHGTIAKVCTKVKSKLEAKIDDNALISEINYLKKSNELLKELLVNVLIN